MKRMGREQEGERSREGEKNFKSMKSFIKVSYKYSVKEDGEGTEKREVEAAREELK